MWIEGHAIVCRLARIADAAGRMPGALRHDADFALFQAALDAADVTLLGRRTHEAAPNLRRRRRLVLTSRPEEHANDECVSFLDPARTDLRAWLIDAFGDRARVAVVGGTAAFDAVAGQLGYDAFSLTIAHRAALPGGPPVFADCFDLPTLKAKLGSLELRAHDRRLLDPAADLELIGYRLTRTHPRKAEGG